MLKVFKYNGFALARIITTKAKPTKALIDFANELADKDVHYEIHDTSVFHCADEKDWEESECCWAKIILGRCSDCKENC